MYKGTSDSEQYMNRTGSESTRFKKTGDNSELKPNEIDVNYTADIAGAKTRSSAELKRMIDELKMKKRKWQAQAQDLNIRLTRTMPFEDYGRYKKQRDDLGRKIAMLQVQLSTLHEEQKALDVGSVRSFGSAFMSIAQQVLPDAVFQEILQETRNFYTDSGIIYDKE